MRSSLKKYDLSRRSAKYASESLPCRSTSRRASRRSAVCWLTAQSRGRSASQTTYVAQMIAALARLIVSPCAKRPGSLLGSMPTNPIVTFTIVSPKTNGGPSRNSAWMNVAAIPYA